jgi:hypothetical protein
VEISCYPFAVIAGCCLWLALCHHKLYIDAGPTVGHTLDAPRKVKTPRPFSPCYLPTALRECRICCVTLRVGVTLVSWHSGGRLLSGIVGEFRELAPVTLKGE